jgi:2-keto-4-pentenoate hydratase/2-oxohepta-3-ene-1,7-dioic acid hydratase in catechol pathway
VELREGLRLDPDNADAAKTLYIPKGTGKGTARNRSRASLNPTIPPESLLIDGETLMKLIRFGEPGGERPGVVLEDATRRDVSGFVPSYDEAFFANDGLARLKHWLKDRAGSAPQVEQSVRLGPPISRPSKIVCIGLNFRDHARESQMEIPKEPVLFFKATTSLVGPNDDLIIPKNGQKVDWEVELAVVIGRTASYIEPEQALEYVAGYVLHNDYSERAFQLERSGQWVKGKSADTFAPLGPFLATGDEIPDTGRLGMWLKVNGVVRQRSSTSEMIFDVPALLSYVSQFMTLLPGDIISTGTPAGVGLGMKPPQYLKPGDVVELGIDGLGESRQRVVAWQPASSRLARSHSSATRL